MESEFVSVAPVRPVAPYIGGKRNLADRIIGLIEQVPHRTYAEPFVGMGGVFLRRRQRPRAEVINDYSRDVANLFRVVQRHYTPFTEMLRYQLASRARFQELADTPPDGLTDMERAARFLYLQRLAFAGRVAGRTFGVDPSSPARFDVTKLIPFLDELHVRLAGVMIECLPYLDFLGRYDRPGTLFYLDPPYWGCEDDYGKELFSQDDFSRLATRLKTLKGHFIMSLNDVEPVRDLFGGFNILPVKTTYTAAKGKATPAREVIIANLCL